MTRRRVLLSILWLVCLPAWADWQWSAAEDVAPPKAGVFHHLDATGRQALAATPGFVALVWSDAGQPRCFLSIKLPGQPFQTRAFGEGECFEPSLAPLDEHRLLLAWEDAGGIRAAVADAQTIHPAATIAPSGSQAVIRHHPALGIHEAWSSADTRFRQILQAPLALQGNLLQPGTAGPVDTAPVTDDQMYPAMVDTQDGISLIWEDRRLGHTVIFGSMLRPGQAWSAPQRISQNRTGKINNDLGRGSGAMRPALARFGSRLAVVWLDKRDFLSGYDVYGSISEDQGKTFGNNLKLQDSFGDAIAQWHAGVAGNAKGDLVIAWDDDRDGNSDIWLTWPKDGGFAEDTAPGPASGALKQIDPVVWLDTSGSLHLAWIEQGETGTRLRYAVGQPK